MELRASTESTYRRQQAQARLARAARIKARKGQNFQPGDAVCYRRVGKSNMKARWYGPGRVFGTETREVDGVRKPGSVI